MGTYSEITKITVNGLTIPEPNTGQLRGIPGTTYNIGAGVRNTWNNALYVKVQIFFNGTLAHTWENYRVNPSQELVFSTSLIMLSTDVVILAKVSWLGTDAIYYLDDSMTRTLLGPVSNEPTLVVEDIQYNIPILTYHPGEPIFMAASIRSSGQAGALNLAVYGRPSGGSWRILFNVNSQLPGRTTPGLTQININEDLPTDLASGTYDLRIDASYAGLTATRTATGAFIIDSVIVPEFTISDLQVNYGEYQAGNTIFASLFTYRKGPQQSVTFQMYCRKNSLNPWESMGTKTVTFPQASSSTLGIHYLDLVVPSGLDAGSEYNVRVVGTYQSIEREITKSNAFKAYEPPPEPDLRNLEILFDGGQFGIGDTVSFTSKLQYKGQGGTLTITKKIRDGFLNWITVGTETFELSNTSLWTDFERLLSFEVPATAVVGRDYLVSFEATYGTVTKDKQSFEVFNVGQGAGVTIQNIAASPTRPTVGSDVLLTVRIDNPGDATEADIKILVMVDNLGGAKTNTIEETITLQSGSVVYSFHATAIQKLGTDTRKVNVSIYGPDGGAKLDEREQNDVYRVVPVDEVGLTDLQITWALGEDGELSNEQITIQPGDELKVGYKLFYSSTQAANKELEIGIVSTKIDRTKLDTVNVPLSPSADGEYSDSVVITVSDNARLGDGEANLYIIYQNGEDDEDVFQEVNALLLEGFGEGLLDNLGDMGRLIGMMILMMMLSMIMQYVNDPALTFEGKEGLKKAAKESLPFNINIFTDKDKNNG